MKKALINPLTFLALLHDVTVASLAWFVAYLLRFNFTIPAEYVQHMVQSLVWVVPLQGAVFISYGLYRGMWRFASVLDLYRHAEVCMGRAYAGPEARRGGLPLPARRRHGDARPVPKLRQTLTWHGAASSPVT